MLAVQLLFRIAYETTLDPALGGSSAMGGTNMCILSYSAIAAVSSTLAGREGSIRGDSG
jgi:hypothetical protein